MQRIYRGGGTNVEVWFQWRYIVTALLEWRLCVCCSTVTLLPVFWTLYHGMVSERLLSIHHRLQIHCIVNVNICKKGPDNKIIVFCRPYKYLNNCGKKNYIKLWQNRLQSLRNKYSLVGKSSSYSDLLMNPGMKLQPCS